MARLYRLCFDPAPFEAEASLSRADAIDWAMRDEERLARALDDHRFNKRASLLNLGRDIAAQSAKLAAAADDSLSGASDSLGAAAMGALSYIGYMQGRRDAYYPAFFLESPSPGAVMGGASLGQSASPAPAASASDS
jgi:hypothetical protein